MKKAKWMKWEPVKGIPQELYCEDLKYNHDGLTVNLQGKDKNSPILTINFEFFLALRIVDEGNLLKDSADIDEAILQMNLEQGSYHKWSLFTVENSPYLEWFHDQSVDIHRDIKIVHHVISTPDDVIEVLDSVIPVVKWN